MAKQNSTVVKCFVDSMIRLSVIVPCRNEIRYIGKCVESILAQDFPKTDMEVLFVDGMSTDGTRDIIAQYCSKYTWMQLIDNPMYYVSYAMNYGVAHSKGEVIMLLGVHSSYAPIYMSTLSSKLNELNADVVGCVCRTDVLNKTPKSLAIKAVLSSRFGVGNSDFRTGVANEQLVDTVPFGCYRRSVFEKYGLFDERLVRNQDIEFNKRIVNNGGSIYLIPQALCTYYARESFRAMARNNYGNGLWNILTVKMTCRLTSLSVRHFVPMMFVLSIIVPLALMPLNLLIGFISAASILAYLFLALLICLKIRFQIRDLKIRHLFTAFVVLHLSYGCGSLVGLFTVRRKSVNYGRH